jgi:hypothetical protein
LDDDDTDDAAAVQTQ